MPFPLRQHEWWLCEEEDCNKSDRASRLESQAWLHYWMQDLRGDTRKTAFIQHLVRNEISAVPVHLPHDNFVRKVEALFVSGQMHVHVKRKEIRGGSGVDDVAFPLANRQPRIASGPATVPDSPIFSPKLNMAAQAAALVAAAASGTPFCEE